MQKFIKLFLISYLLLFITAFVIIKYDENRSDYSNEDYKKEVAAIQSERKLVDQNCREAWVIKSFETLYPYWLGTKWDFNGTSQTPGEGSIACGYFVTTLIRDMGFNINRIKLAQCASEEMIKSLCDGNSIKRFYSGNNDSFLEHVRNNGENFYIVGLDIHIGFILNDGNEIYFIHSSYWQPDEVVKQKADEAQILLSSQYKVLGCLNKSEKIWSF